jgi:hypothetical protein
MESCALRSLILKSLCLLFVCSANELYAQYHDCTNPYVISIPGDLPYVSNVLTTCGSSGDTWTSGCLPPGFENTTFTIHQLDVTERARLRILLNTYLPTPHPGFAVISACGGAPECLAGASSLEDYWVTTDVTLDPGTYFVKVGNYSAPNCLATYQLAIDPLALPPGETCDEATDLGTLPANVSGNTCGYFNDYDLDCPDPSAAPDAVYRYTPAQDGQVTFDLCSSNYDTKLLIYSDDCLLTPWDCNDDAPGICGDPTRSFLECVMLFAGSTYYIVVDGGQNNCGDYTLIVTPCLEEGETCDNAILVDVLPISLGGNTCGRQDNYDYACPNASASPDVVYRFAPDSTIDVTLDFCASTFDVKAWVYDGDCGSGPIMCADDTPGICGNSLAPFVTCMQFTGGHTYYIVIDGSNNDCGDWSLIITPCLPGELFENAIVISGVLPQEIVGNSCPYEHNYEWSCPEPGSGPDVIYRYTPEVNMNLNLSMCESSYDAQLVVWGQLEGSIIACADYGNGWCADDSRPFLSCVPLTAGGNYYFVVDGGAGVCGDFLLRLSACHESRPCVECAPVNVELGEIGMDVCGYTIAGDCEWSGKWLASFLGHANALYHFDLCVWESCVGEANFDADIVILDEACHVLASVDGEEGCGWSPNDWAWECPSDGLYYIHISPWPSIENDELTCHGSLNETFTLNYCRSGDGESCASALSIGALPFEYTEVTCDRLDDHDAVCLQETEQGGRDLVFRYSPQSDELVTFSLCGTLYQTKLYVFADSCQGEPLACSVAAEVCGEAWFNSYLTCVPLLLGHDYFVVADAINEWECGELQFFAEPCAMLEGDLIETAFEIPALPYSDENNTSAFFDQYVEECGDYSVAKDVVYRFTPQTDVAVEVDLCNSCFDNRLYVYENTRDNLIACDDNGCWPSYRAYLAGVDLFAGNTYYFVVDGDYSARGSYQLDILERVLGRCCRTDGSCSDFVTSRQCSYHLMRGEWTEGLECTTPCPDPPAPPSGPLHTTQMPVINGCGYGTHLAASCSGELFYNNTCSEILYTTDLAGNYRAEVTTTRDGNPIWFLTGCWDNERGALWGGHNSDVGTLDPATGEFSYRFNTLGIVFEFMSYDQTDHTLWFGTHSCNELMHFDTSGNHLGSVIPRDAMGNMDAVINGVAAGGASSLYVSHWDSRVTKIDKLTGEFLETTMIMQDSAGSALACDAANFPGQTALWWKFGASASAYSIPPGACSCACLPPDSVAVVWQADQIAVSFHAPVEGNYAVYRSEVPGSTYPANFTLKATVPALAGRNNWLDPDTIQPFALYVVVHVSN